LKNYCEIVSLRDIPFAVRQRHSRPVAAVTFDDGFQNTHAVAFPILERFGIPATVFLVTDLVDSENTVWFCRIHEALCRTPLKQVEWEGTAYDLSSVANRASTHSAIQRRLKEDPHPQLIAKMRRLVESLGDDPRKPILNGSPYRMLGTTEIREMLASGLIDFGAHTCSHAILSGLATVERQREISDSLEAVGRLTGVPCRLFAFPNGGANDYGRDDVEALEGRGVATAVTTIAGPNDSTVPALELRRYGVGHDTSMALFQLLTHHVLSAVARAA
jgi:peptidoglycan/xylan/chitin deacetylase (PgdA/CDA1 family)